MLSHLQPEIVETAIQPPRPAAAWTAAVHLPVALVIALCMAAISLWLFTRNNDFPVHYHPDEWTKAEQIMDYSQDRNYNHPLLLLESANLAVRWFDVPLDSRNVVIAGRWTSAALASIGVFALAMAGYVAHGFVGLLIGGLAIALCPPLLVHAHYFKEDTALLVGVMVALLGARLVIAARYLETQLLATVVLAVGCGLAMSGKYVGAMVLIPAAVTLLIARNPRWTALPARLGVFVLLAAATVVIINYRAFLDWSSLRLNPFAAARIQQEFAHGTSGHFGVTLGKPNIYCLRTAIQDMMPHLWVLGAAGVPWLLVRPRITRGGIAMVAFLLAFIAVLGFSAIPFSRYALPITICAYFLLAQLASNFAADLHRTKRWGWTAAAACAGVIVLLQGYRCLKFDDYFLNDSRQQMREWIAQNVPAGARITADNYTLLQREGDPWRFPQQSPLRVNVMNSGFASNSAHSPQALAARGVDYVAVAEMSYGRFFVPGVRPQARYEEYSFKQARQFYTELFANGKLVWSSAPSPSTNSYVNSEVRLYSIAHLAGRDSSNPQQPQRGGFLQGLFR